MPETPSRMKKVETKNQPLDQLKLNDPLTKAEKLAKTKPEVKDFVDMFQLIREKKGVDKTLYMSHKDWSNIIRSSYTITKWDILSIIATVATFRPNNKQWSLLDAEKFIIRLDNKGGIDVEYFDKDILISREATWRNLNVNGGKFGLDLIKKLLDMAVDKWEKITNPRISSSWNIGNESNVQDIDNDLEKQLKLLT